MADTPSTPARRRPAATKAAASTKAVTIAESLVRLGLSTSKVRTYAPPRAKRITGFPLP